MSNNIEVNCEDWRRSVLGPRKPVTEASVARNLTLLNGRAPFPDARKNAIKAFKRKHYLSRVILFLISKFRKYL
jgi:hypothetical protein